MSTKAQIALYVLSILIGATILITPSTIAFMTEDAFLRIAAGISFLLIGAGGMLIVQKETSHS